MEGEQQQGIFGLPVSAEVPSRWIPLEAVAIVKCLDGQGEARLMLVHTPDLSLWEACGMLEGAHARAVDDLRRAFTPDFADEGGGD